jgi:hypothetical protein
VLACCVANGDHRWVPFIDAVALDLCLQGLAAALAIFCWKREIGVILS